jgi:uncharacterized alpha-E superfamily protein
MQGSFPFDLILFGMVAAFLVLRLRSVLGKRQGFERPPAEARPTAPVAMGREAPRAAPAAAPIVSGIAAQAISRIGAIDTSFEPAAFLGGAEGAFRMIVTAFAAMTRADLGGAIPSLASAARGTASSIRERLAPDAWRVLGDLQRLDQAPPAAPTGADLFELANAALRTLSAFAGLAQENMNRHSGWRFLDLGRRIERGIATARFAAMFGEEAASFGDLDVLLELADSQITYRSRYLAGLARTPVIDLVLLDPANPRSLAFQIGEIEEHLAMLPGGTGGGPLTPPQRIAARLATDLRTADPATVTVDDVRAGERALLSMSDEIATRFFSHRGRPEAVAAEELG